MTSNHNNRSTLTGLNTVNEMAIFCYENVFRSTLSQPGYVVLDFGPEFDSRQLRKRMVALKKALELKIEKILGGHLSYQWLGRFDQQGNTKFHIDNAQDYSFLMLGYEPSEVRSELYFLDYPQYASDHGMSLDTFFDRFDPLDPSNQTKIESYKKQVSPWIEGHYKIVLVNNCNGKQDQDLNIPGLGVFHKAVVPDQDATKTRVVNSMMLELKSGKKEISMQETEKGMETEFETTTNIST